MADVFSTDDQPYPFRINDRAGANFVISLAWDQNLDTFTLESKPEKKERLAGRKLGHWGCVGLGHTWGIVASRGWAFSLVYTGHYWHV